MVTLGSRGQVFLRDNIAVTNERIDHLVEIGTIGLCDHKHRLGAGALKTFQYRHTTLVTHKRLDLI